MSRTISHDIALKCADDVAAAIRRNMTLVDNPGEQFAVAVGGAAAAIGAATGAFTGLAEKPFDVAALDAVWTEIIRPFALDSLGDSSAFQAILDMYPPNPPPPNQGPHP